MCAGDRIYSGVLAGFQTTKLGPQPLWNSTFTDQLRRDLLLNYDKFARPTQHYNVTKVKLGLTIRHIEINEFKAVLTVHSWLKMSWDDDKLKWDPSKYGGIHSLNLADHELWQPDIFLYNSATSTAINHYNTHCIVFSNGNVLWVPPAQFSVLCNLNLKYWPFDSQECSMKFGSWTYSGDQIDLDVYNNDTDVKSTMTVHRVTAEEMRDHQVTDFDDMHVGDDHGIVRSHHSEKTTHQDDWVLLAAAIDKISFIAYSLLFVILAIVYSV
ncbi:hypothetical protein GWI33_007337 [Rhynchophorus ferrugineus]|uniref:Neurotransmitter-gated ion-channel ligand-binding domain-containing protein n=1 Tax=Rhynchophorus ferrugineus TaxID=354439 RepID=A0A834IEL5_RHYFE|nr:hypothetical protein GWI33_007337 [Rhynchophorus ferrugineus]